MTVKRTLGRAVSWGMGREATIQGQRRHPGDDAGRMHGDDAGRMHDTFRLLSLCFRHSLCLHTINRSILNLHYSF